MSSEKDMLVSCLCVTEERSAFMPWLLWCFDRQDWPLRELVIVDSSDEPLQIADRNDVRVVALPKGSSVSRKRNCALKEARGEIVTWFDDDDWQHPHKLCCLVKALSDGASYAGSQRAWFVDLKASRCAAYCSPKGQIAFNSAGFIRAAVQKIRFREDLRRASDTKWMRMLAACYGDRAAVLERDDLFFWLSHETNLSNPTRKRRFPDDLDVLRKHIGAEAWADTDDALDSLRTRVEKTYPRRELIFVSTPAVMKDAREGDPKPPPVGVMIKATVLDAPFLDVMVRHMISQAKYPFAEKAIVVDSPDTFSGKYQARPRTNRAELDRVLNRLLTDGIIDCVREVDPAPEIRNEIVGRYFPSDAHCVPTHAVSGGPIYATLFGLESMATDYVLQMDADVLFHTGPSSWVVQALRCMNADPSLWLMMTHPGPPAGPVGKSLGSQNQRRATWDEKLSIWRFRHATTRYFLCDRRKLHNRIPIVTSGQGCAPLENCIGHALKQHGAFRGNLGNLESWHLHVWHHGDPFPAKVTSLTKVIEAGLFPASQRGNYDLRLDRAPVRLQWEELFEQQDEPAVSLNVEAVESRKEHAAPVQDSAPLTVVIPVRDRRGRSLRNALRSLHWQSIGRPAQILIISHGSQPDTNHELARLCEEQSTTLIEFGDPAHAWNKSLALNTGIRSSLADVPFLMTMDADMILAPNFLAVVVQRLSQDPPALVLCQISDLPAETLLPDTNLKLRESFDELLVTTQLRPRYGTGGIQAATRSFFFNIRGYDEDLIWWGAMDGDVVNRARLTGMEIEWIEDRTAMLHQWHPRKHRILKRPNEIDEAQRAWRANHTLVKSRRLVAKRNPISWGGKPSNWQGLQ